MKKKLFGSMLLCATAMISQAQFTKIYDGGEQGERGYDIVMNDGYYYFSRGNYVDHSISRIDPNTGAVSISVISQVTGSEGFAFGHNPVGKQSLQVSNACTNYASDNTFVMPGMWSIAYYHDMHFNYYKVRDAGFNFAQVTKTKFSPLGECGIENMNLNFDSYSDQTEVDTDQDGMPDWRYFAGVQRQNKGSGYQFAPFVVRKKMGVDWPGYGHVDQPMMSLMQSSAMGLGMHGSGTYYPDMIPTRIIADHEGKAWISYGSVPFNGSQYDNSTTSVSLKRDAGIYGLGTNFWIEQHYTFHTTDEDNNLGVAQSIIVDPRVGNPNNVDLVFVASGEHHDYSPADYGDWNKDYFHIVRLERPGLQLLKAKKINLVSLQANSQVFDEHGHSAILEHGSVGYKHVQVNDVVKAGSNYFVVGSATKSTVNNLLVYEDPAQVTGPSYIDEKVVFILALDENFDPVPNSTGEPLAREYYLSEGDKEVTKLQVNRIKRLNGEFFIVGTVEYDSHPNIQQPFLIKEVDLEGWHGCSDEIAVHAVDVTLIRNGISHSTTNKPVADYGDIPNVSIVTYKDMVVCTEIPYDIEPDPDGPGSGKMPQGSGDESNALAALKASVKVYQTNRQVSVQSEQNLKQCAIYDMNGSTVFVGNNNQEFNLDLPTSGIYLVRCLDYEGRTYTNKIMCP